MVLDREGLWFRILAAKYALVGGGGFWEVAVRDQCGGGIL